ncbi:receptor-type tyrosine-protein phosphatase eta [Trichonephila clavipes]|nr:receptor-type tyrosine-protein phosphatase eta [Trichonephila clavipes]
MAYWIYFTLFLFIQLQAKVSGDCETPWNVTIQNSLIITWSGEDRETDVLVQVTPDATSLNKECKSQNLTVPFSAKEVRIDPLCSNTTHIIKASLACGGKITQIKEFELLSDGNKNMCVGHHTHIRHITLYHFEKEWKPIESFCDLNELFGGKISKSRCWKGTATAGSDVVQSGRPIFDDFFQHLWPYIGNNTANVVFQMVKRLWLIRIDQ